MGASTMTAFPWRIVAHLCWAESAGAAGDPPHVREVRSTIVADLIALRRLARRVERGDARDWLDRHPALADFLHWCDDVEGCVSRARAKGALGPILDNYLRQLRGQRSAPWKTRWCRVWRASWLAAIRGKFST